MGEGGGKIPPSAAWAGHNISRQAGALFVFHPWLRTYFPFLTDIPMDDGLTDSPARIELVLMTVRERGKSCVCNPYQIMVCVCMCSCQW